MFHDTKKTSGSSLKNNKTNSNHMHQPKNEYHLLCENIGYFFKNTQLLRQALTRQNAIQENNTQAAILPYQRLEFLGDRLVNLLVTEQLYEQIPDLTEDELTTLASQLTANKGIMVNLARHLCLDKYLVCGKGELMVVDKMCADALEAITAAIYLDAGIEETRRFIQRHWQVYIQHARSNYYIQKMSMPVSTNTTSMQENLNTMTSAKSIIMKDDDNHFEGGAYEFRKEILKLDEKTLNIPNIHQLRKREACYGTSSLDYYVTFLPLIIEEARAILAAGNEDIEAGKNKGFEAFTEHYKFAKNIANPAVLELSGKIPDLGDMGHSTLGILLKPQPAVCSPLLGIADYQEKTRRLKVKFINPAFQSQANNIKSWQAYILGSLVCQQRMYDVCKAMPVVDFQYELMAGKLRSPEIRTTSCPVRNTDYAENLNPSQEQAINSFLARKTGVQCLQGPPGTGKTTTIVALLKNLYQGNQRTLVCAPSNKAVHVLASRFIEKSSPDGVVFAGVKKNLPKELEFLFLHAWSDAYEDISSAYSQINYIEYNYDTIKKSFLLKKIENVLHDMINIPKQVKQFFPHLHAKYAWDDFQGCCQVLNDLKFSLLDDGTTISKMDNHQKISFLNSLRISGEILKKLVVQIESEGKQLELRLLNNAKIIFCTLSVAGRSMMKEIKNIDVLIVDESGQSIEAETLIPFQLKPRKMLLVGDTRQLPPTVISSHATKFSYEWSMMWRLLEECKQPYDMLDVQYRMHPDICRWPATQYYDGRLQNSNNVKERKPQWLTKLHPALAPYIFLDVEGKEEQQNHSYRNLAEARHIIQLLLHMQNDAGINVNQQVGIITSYAAQVDLIKQELRKNNLDVKVNSVDGFQGEENDIIIMSFVRANPKGSIGFLKDERRLNVAITRARHALVMLGNSLTLRKKKSDIASLIADAYERKAVHSAATFMMQLGQRNIQRFFTTETLLSQPVVNKQLLQDKLQYIFKNPMLLVQALTRQSAISEILNEAAITNNANMQVIGDKIIHLVLASWLYDTFPADSEEKLHEKLVAIISDTGFYQTMAKKIDINFHVLRGEGEKTLTEKMLIHSVKALFGAIYCDSKQLHCVYEIIMRLTNDYEPIGRHITIKTNTNVNSSQQTHFFNSGNKQNKSRKNINNGNNQCNANNEKSIKSTRQNVQKPRNENPGNINTSSNFFPGQNINTVRKRDNNTNIQSKINECKKL